MTAIVLRGDARALPLPDESVDLIVTSPPYFGLRSYTDEGYCAECRIMREQGRDPRQAWPDYQAHWDEVHKPRHYAGQVGSEATPAEFLAALWECTAEWVRVLKPEGSMFINLGDKYDAGTNTPRRVPGDLNWIREASSPRSTTGRPKSLLGLPWRYALGCMDQLGLILRAEIIWAKPNGLPESVTDRVRRSHEQVFHFTRSPRYYAAVDEIREPQVGGVVTGGGARRGRGHGGDALQSGTFSKDGGFNAYREQNGVAYNPLGKLPGSVWNIPSQPLTVPPGLGVDHFAAFPSELPRRIIAGWSPPGVCTACGQGRRPVTMAEFTDAGGRGNERYDRWGAAAEVLGMGTRKPQEMKFGRANRTTTITGYACACPDTTAPTRPAIVADPFGGTGTTALVASVLGRTGITIDRSRDYCRLARWRTTDPGERCRVIGAPKPPPVADGQDALFAL